MQICSYLNTVMKTFCVLLFMVFLGSYNVVAQAPSVVKAVGSTVSQPASADQEGWKSNEWNGLFFTREQAVPQNCV